jgi:hypothetical protein
MADPRKRGETPTTASSKSSAMRWALGVAAIFIIGVIAWWVSGLPRGESPAITPQNQLQNQQQNQSGSGNAGVKEPSAVIPNQDTGSSPPATPQPAGPGTQ